MLIVFPNHWEPIGKPQKLISQFDDGDLHELTLSLLAVMVLNERIGGVEGLLEGYM